MTHSGSQYAVDGQSEQDPQSRHTFLPADFRFPETPVLEDDRRFRKPTAQPAEPLEHLLLERVPASPEEVEIEFGELRDGVTTEATTVVS